MLRPLHRHFRRRADGHRRDRRDPHGARSRRSETVAEIARGRDDDDAGRAGRLKDFVACFARSSATGDKGIVIDRRGRRDARASKVGDTGARGRALMALREINFDGIVGPSHNYAGLSLGNLASTRNAGEVSQPRAAALQGIDKMRANLALGLAQGIFVPHPRPDRALARRARHDDRGCRAGARRQRHVRLGDVGGQCRDGLARARHRRRHAAT